MADPVTLRFDPVVTSVPDHLRCPATTFVWSQGVSPRGHHRCVRGHHDHQESDCVFTFSLPYSRTKT